MVMQNRFVATCKHRSADGWFDPYTIETAAERAAKMNMAWIRNNMDRILIHKITALVINKLLTSYK
jgi:hypothetical protein